MLDRRNRFDLVLLRFLVDIEDNSIFDDASDADFDIAPSSS
jgi:hypothetical protein